MEVLQGKCYCEKKALNLKNEHTKLCDLKILENQAVPGSITSGHEVSSYVSSKKNEQTKIKRLHTEVRYAWKTSLAPRKSPSLFQLKIDSKNLSTAVPNLDKNSI